MTSQLSPFNRTGFLSDLSLWTSHVRATHEAWFALVDDLNEQAMAALYASAPKRPNQQQLVASLLFGRALQSFQACVLLIGRGMTADARTLVRSAAESAIALGGLASDVAFLDDLVAGHDRHTIGITNALLNDPECLAELNAEDLTRLRNVVDDLLAKYQGNKPPSINWEAVAARAGMRSLYLTIYREMSGDGAHVTARGLNRHIRADEENEIKYLAFEPSDDDLQSNLSAGISALLCAMEALARVYDADATHAAVAAFGERWRVLCGIPHPDPTSGQ